MSKIDFRDFFCALAHHDNGRVTILNSRQKLLRYFRAVSIHQIIDFNEMDGRSDTHTHSSHSITSHTNACHTRNYCNIYFISDIQLLQWWNETFIIAINETKQNKTKIKQKCQTDIVLHTFHSMAYEWTICLRDFNMQCANMLDYNTKKESTTGKQANKQNNSLTVIARGLTKIY